MFDADPDIQVSERDARALALLAELAGIGMALARDLGRRAADDETPLDPAEAALAFSRLSRAVRLTIALEQRLAEAAPARAEAAARAWRVRIGHERALRAAGRKDEAEALVARALAAEGRDGFEADAVLEELSERLDEADDDDWLTDVPIAVMAARICRDLGVAFDPDVWAEAVGTQAPENPDPDPDPGPDPASCGAGPDLAAAAEGNPGRAAAGPDGAWAGGERRSSA